MGTLGWVFGLDHFYNLSDFGSFSRIQHCFYIFFGIMVYKTDVWFHWGLNPGPSACKADVMTATLWNLCAEIISNRPSRDFQSHPISSDFN